MNFYTLDGLKTKAVQLNKSICAWRPLIHGKAINDGKFAWIYDWSASAASYRARGLGVNEYSHRIIVKPNGEVEGLEQDGTTDAI